MPPHIRDPLAVARPLWAYGANGMVTVPDGARPAIVKGCGAVASLHSAPPSLNDRADAMDWLRSHSMSFKMGMVADYVAGLWEVEPTEFHRMTLRQIGLDLTQSFGVCDFSLLVSVHYLTRLKTVFDRARIHTRDCSAQLFTVALLAAVKFLVDVPPSNADWADVSHFERQRMNQMELELLEALDFNLFVDWPEARDVLYEVFEQHPSVTAVDARLREPELGHAPPHNRHALSPEVCWSDMPYPAEPHHPHPSAMYCESSLPPLQLQPSMVQPRLSSVSSFASVPHTDDYDHTPTEVTPDFTWRSHDEAIASCGAVHHPDASSLPMHHHPGGWFPSLDSPMKQGPDGYDMWSYEASGPASGYGRPVYGQPAYASVDPYQVAVHAGHVYAREAYDLPPASCNPGGLCCAGGAGHHLPCDARFYSDSLFATATF